MLYTFQPRSQGLSSSRPIERLSLALWDGKKRDPGNEVVHIYGLFKMEFDCLWVVVDVFEVVVDGC